MLHQSCYEIFLKWWTVSMMLQIELNSELYLCCTLPQLFKSTSISHHSNPLRTFFHHHFGILHRKEKKHSHLLWSTIIHAFIHTETRCLTAAVSPASRGTQWHWWISCGSAGLQCITRMFHRAAFSCLPCTHGREQWPRSGRQSLHRRWPGHGRFFPANERNSYYVM